MSVAGPLRPTPRASCVSAFLHQKVGHILRVKIFVSMVALQNQFNCFFENETLSGVFRDSPQLN